MRIHASRDEGITTLRLDDGKANAFDTALFDELRAAVDDSGDDAVVIAGRDGMFSAGLDTTALASLDEDGLTELLVAFGRTLVGLWVEPKPLVAAATGHAVAAGTLLAMAADHAVAARGEFRWGLTETTIGFPLPAWAITLARGNVRADRLEDLLLPGDTVLAEEAVAVGFADVLADPDQVLPRARERAAHLAGLPRAAYAETKRRLRGAAAEQALAGLESDTRDLLAAR